MLPTNGGHFSCAQARSIKNRPVINRCDAELSTADAQVEEMAREIAALREELDKCKADGETAMSRQSRQKESSASGHEMDKLLTMVAHMRYLLAHGKAHIARVVDQAEQVEQVQCGEDGGGLVEGGGGLVEGGEGQVEGGEGGKEGTGKNGQITTNGVRTSDGECLAGRENHAQKGKPIENQKNASPSSQPPSPTVIPVPLTRHDCCKFRNWLDLVDEVCFLELLVGWSSFSYKKIDF